MLKLGTAGREHDLSARRLAVAPEKMSASLLADAYEFLQRRLRDAEATLLLVGLLKRHTMGVESRRLSVGEGGGEFMEPAVVVVTGGGRGIGRSVCERFAASGAQVVAAARSPKELDETRAAIEGRQGRCHTRVTDVGSAEEIETLIEETQARFGRIDVLVNNAGVAPQAPIDELEEPLFDTIVLVNVRAVYRGCRAVWPVMRGQGGGVIVNISSVASVDPFPGFTAYGASKAWVNAWTRGLADEGRSVGIRVFAVAPGAVETRMLRDPFPSFPKEQALQPSDVADVVFVLAQPECRYATGQTVFVKK